MRTEPGQAGRVIALRHRTTGIDETPLRQVEAYWEGLRDGRPLPRRADVLPTGLGPFIDSAFLLESLGPGRERFRVAGRLFHDLMGMDVRGMPASTLIEPAARERVKGHLEALFATPARIRLELAAPGAPDAPGRPALAGRVLLLPLLDDAGAVTRALGCLALNGQPGRPPCRFTLAGAEAEPLAAAGYAERSPKPAPRHEFAEPPAPPLHAPAPPSPPPRAGGRPHLHLVKGGRDDREG